MTDAPNRCQLRLELAEIIRVRVAKLLDGYGLAVLQGKLVHVAGSPVSDQILIAEIPRRRHNVLISVDSHVHLKDHELRRCMVVTWSRILAVEFWPAADPVDGHKDHR